MSGHNQESEDHVKKKNAVCREIANANVVVLVYVRNREFDISEYQETFVTS